MNTEVLNVNLLSLILLTALLGLRHGFDADHIALVDGITRSRQVHQSYWLARRVGAQFAIGHSAVILIVSMLLYKQSAALPSWLDSLGMVISTSFLLVVAASNFGHALGMGSNSSRPASPYAAALFRLTGRQLHPALVGAAFAVSFDSLAQAAFFASKGFEWGGVLLMALAFGLGMTFADAANGALLSWFASRSDRLARQASRFSSGFIALIALLTAGAAIMREYQASVAALWEHLGVWVGVGLVAFTSLVYMLRIAFQRFRVPSAVVVAER